MSLLLFSGGKESLYNLHVGRRKVELMLLINYGQKAFQKEFESLKYYSELYEKEKLVLDISGSYDKSLLPFGISGDPNSEPGTHVPMRNTLFISYAVMAASHHGIDTVVVGAVTPYEKALNDGLSGYLPLINKITRLDGVNVTSYCKNLNQSQVAHSLMERKVDISHLWSCFEVGTKHCGKCEKCINMKRELSKLYPLGKSPKFIEALFK